MPELSRPSGVRVTLPASLSVGAAPEAAPARRGRGLPGRVFGPVVMPGGGGPGPGRDPLIEALREQELELVDQIELEPGPAPGGAPHRGPGVGESAAVGLELEVAAHEDAVVLLEQGGLYAWNFPTTVENLPPPLTRRGTAGAGTRRVQFQVRLEPAPPAGGARRGLLTDILFDRARAYVLKFAARLAVGQVMSYLERNVRRGLVVMDADDPAEWRMVDSIAQVTLPADRPARVLLFVHGTFSSTVGSFGGLGATPWGRALLAAARANYDAIIGFDHPTLSEDPLANATDLLRRLEGRRWKHRLRFDAVSFSRGGIVFRSLVEHLLPVSAWKPLIERAVFVGCVNGGTQLATPDNWRTLIDLYTNLAAAACRAVGLLPGALPAATILRETIRSVGAFVKFLATAAVTDRGVPGLAAMEPEGAFIRSLNAIQPGQPLPEDSNYFAITSGFQPDLVKEGMTELPRALVGALVSGLVHQLMGESNDLVVNTASMTAIDPEAGTFIKDHLDFGRNGAVYHLNYFLQPQTANALARWLELAAPDEAGAEVTTRRLAPVGAAAAARPPAGVDTDILVVGADEAAEVTLEQIRTRTPSYVVVERFDQGDEAWLYYAFKAEEVLRQCSQTVDLNDETLAGGPRLITRSGLLEQVLDLHEPDASPTGTLSGLPGGDPSALRATARRGVVMDGDRPMGVLPEAEAPLTTEALVALAAKVAEPKSDTDQIVRRRGLPTLEPAPEAFAAMPAMRGGGAAPPSPAPPAMPAAGSPDRGQPREDEPPRAPAPAPAPAAKVTCHFHAEMPDEIEVAKAATIEVIVSREVIGRAERAGARGARGEADPTRKLIINLLPKENIECVGDDRVEADLPAAGNPLHVYFDVQGTAEGPGEVWVMVRQGQVPLILLKLHPRIVPRRPAAARRTSAEARTPEAPRLSEPVHTLHIFERKKGDAIGYLFLFDSPELKMDLAVDSPEIKGDRQGYIDNLYKEIEQRWLGCNSDVEAFEQELRAFGAQLWSELIPERLQAELWKHRLQIQSIRVMSEEPFIPWELVHMKEPGQPLPDETLFLAQKGLVRWLHGSGPPERLWARPGRCRYVIPHYPHSDYRLKEAEKEIAFLDDRLKATPVEPQPNEVRKLLAEGGAFDLLHFACHGVAEHGNIANAQLLMQGAVTADRKYVPAYLSATTVGQHARIRGREGEQPIVVLNACQAGKAGYQLTGIGGFAKAFLGAGAGLFIGSLWSVGDRPARTFTETFYARLLAGDTVARAAITAREEARKARDATWLAYAVYGHPHAKLLTA